MTPTKKMPINLIKTTKIRKNFENHLLFSMKKVFF